MWLTIYYIFCYLIFGYTLAIMTSYLFFIYQSFRAQQHLAVEMPDDETIKYQMKGSPLTPAVSIIAPAYNEEVTIIDNVNSLMQIDYPDYEIIIVNDASSDRTLELLVETFEMVEVPYDIAMRVPSKPIKRVLKSTNPQYSKLVVVDKERGGRKSDGSNAGINVCSNRYFVCTDVDCIVEPMALYRMMWLVVNSHVPTIGVSATMLMSNGCLIDDGHVAEARVPGRLLPMFQMLEYMRSFLISKLGWSNINALPNISGGFGLFDTDVVVKSGGYDNTSMAEDVDMLLRMVTYMKNSGQDFRIAQVPKVCCWTEGPSSLKALYRQRIRWARGLFEIISNHRKLFFNPHYGPIGAFTLPFIFLFEFMAPVLEFYGYIFMIWLLFVGGINWNTALIIFSMIYLFSVLMCFFLLYFDYSCRAVEWHNRRRAYWHLAFAAFIEPFIYHPLITYCSNVGYFQYIRKTTAVWKPIARTGVKKKQKTVATILLMLLLPLTLVAQKKDDVHTSRYYVNRIRHFVEQGAWHEAKREINSALELYPRDPDIRYYNGRYYYVVGQLNEARYNLVRSTQEDDQHFSSRRLLVDVEDTLHHYSSAICYINELLEFQPYDRDLWRRKIGLYRKIGNVVEADAALERLAHIYPMDSVVQRERRQRNRESWNQVLKKSSATEAAENLEQWLDLDPGNREYYEELISVYERMGEYERALGTVNRALTRFPHDAIFVSKGLGIMTGMGLNTQALAFARQHGVSPRIYEGLLQGVAEEGRLRDPYEANGRLYALSRDTAALTYLINTSLTRGYEDDARYYLSEAMRRSGRTPRLLAKQYALEKRCGNERAMVRLLEEMARLQPDEELSEDYAALMITLAGRDMQAEQWADADANLARALSLMTPENPAWGAAVARRITAIGRQGRLSEARDFCGQSIAQTDSAELRTRFASAFEDLAANRLRALIEEEQYERALAEAREYLEFLPESEPMLRSCINMCQTLHRDDLFQTYALRGYEAYPGNPYFINKQAISLMQQQRAPMALALLRPRRGADEWVNPQLTAAYSGISHEWATQLLRYRMPDLALAVVDSALVCDSTNRELLYDRGLACERLKDWAAAYELQKRYYEPSNAEQQEYYEHMRWLGYQSLRNRVDATYTHALYDTKADGLASVGHLYSIATVAYSRLTRRNTYTGQISYKGIDGTHYNDFNADGQEVEINEGGGVGLELTGQWDHTFNARWSGLVSLSWSNRYFNRFGANVGASYAANRGWTPSLRLGYRRTPKTYLYLGDDSYTTLAEGHYNLFFLTPSLEKAWERIRVSGNVSLTLFNTSLYYNVGLRGKLFVKDDNVSSVALVTGFGSFPELSFFEQTALRGVAHTNAMVGFDAQFLVTRHLCLGLSGSWNTCYNPRRLADGTLADSYRNIYSLAAQLHVAF